MGLACRAAGKHPESLRAGAGAISADPSGARLGTNSLRRPKPGAP